MIYKTKCLKRIVLTSFFLLSILIQLSGCSIARYDTGDLSKNPQIAKIELNSIEDMKSVFEKVEIREYDPNTNRAIFYFEGIKTSIGDIALSTDKTFSVKYHRSLIYPAPYVNILVEFPNGRQYVAYLDTGCNEIVLSGDVVLDNELDIYPIGTICRIPELKIGPARIEDTIAFYEQQQWQFRVLNIPLYKHSSVILGRKLIRSFDYVMFDNVNEEAVFSKEGAFEPDNPQLWSSYSFTEDPNHEDTIMVQIPIAGQVLEVAFDSCGGKPGLSLNESHWQAIEKDLKVKRLVNSKITTWQGMIWSGQKAKVSEISIGDNITKNADVLIYDDPDNLSGFSLGYFQDTAVVLDFVNNLMWIKK